MQERWPGRVSTLAGAVVVVLAAVFLLHSHTYFFDDSFITLRYATHLAEGLGPRWNTTGSPVEGFTSPLHVFLIALLLKCHLSSIGSPRVLAFCSHGLLLLQMWPWCRRRYGVVGATLAVSGVLGSFAILLWDLGGLEAVPFAVLCTSGTLALLDYREEGKRASLIAASALWALACLTRLDGIVPAAFTAACLFATAPVRGRTRLAHASIFAGAIAAALLPYEVFRWYYFHDLLPNTYYAKVFGIPKSYLISAGRHYLHVFVVTAPWTPLLLAAVAAVQAVRRAFTARSLFLYGWIGSVVLYVVLNGGDYMFGFRFLLTVIPMLYITLADGLNSLGWLQKRDSAVAVTAIFLVTLAAQFRSNILYQPDGDLTSLAGKIVGEHIARAFPHGTVIALNAAGATPFYADDYVYIDMLGLNDREIARRYPVPVSGAWVQRLGHLKADGASVLRRRPDIILLGPPSGVPVGTGQAPYLSDRELTESAAFQREYMLCSQVIHPDEREQSALHRFGIAGDQHLYFYSRKDGAWAHRPDCQQAPLLP